MKTPTVDDLVKIFKDNNWKVCQRDGANVSNIKNGECCALPALAKFSDPEYKFESDYILYDYLCNLYGSNEIQSLWMGFDNWSFMGYVDQNFYNLGKDLYNKLTNEKV